MDYFSWIFTGIFATILITIFELLLLLRINRGDIPEFNENAVIMSKLFKKSWDSIYWYGLPLHFLHGVIAAIIFGLLVEMKILDISVISGIFFGLILWLFLLIIHFPITKENIFSPFPTKPFVISLFSHIIFGLALIIC